MSLGTTAMLAALAIAKASWAGQLGLSETVAKLDRSRIPERRHWRASERFLIDPPYIYLRPKSLASKVPMFLFHIKTSHLMLLLPS